MESKICTYTEKNIRLQLIKVDSFYEIRFNRVLIKRDKDLEYMRYYFVNRVHQICVWRQSPLSILTFDNT